MRSSALRLSAGVGRGANRSDIYSTPSMLCHRGFQRWMPILYAELLCHRRYNVGFTLICALAIRGCQRGHCLENEGLLRRPQAAILSDEFLFGLGQRGVRLGLPRSRQDVNHIESQRSQAAELIAGDSNELFPPAYGFETDVHRISNFLLTQAQSFPLFTQA